MQPHRTAKVIITGTGRAGTTFLVRLLTELGLDTGYTAETWREEYHEHCEAGLEKDLEDPAAPYIVKSPELRDTLAAVLARGQIVIDCALIPIRRLEDAALSRIRVGGDGHTPGGLIGTADPQQQKAVLAEGFHHLVETLAVHEIPHVFLHFPRFAQDPDYAYAKLKPILGELSRERFRPCFIRLAKPELIHSFARGLPADAGRPARIFELSRHRRRLRRSVLRGAALVAMAALGWFAAGRINRSQPETRVASAHLIRPAGGPASGHYGFELPSSTPPADPMHPPALRFVRWPKSGFNNPAPYFSAQFEAASPAPAAPGLLAPIPAGPTVN